MYLKELNSKWSIEDYEWKVITNTKSKKINNIKNTMEAEKIISRIREEIDKIYEKYEGNPLVEQEDIMEGFEDIIVEYYEDLSPM